MLKRKVLGNKVTLDLYDRCKYTMKEWDDIDSHIKSVKYNDVEAFEIVRGRQASDLESETDGSCIDDYHEYLMIYFSNGETATYRNSYVDLFTF